MKSAIAVLLLCMAASALAAPGYCKGAVADKCCTQEIVFGKDLAVTSPLTCGVVLEADQAKTVPAFTKQLETPGAATEGAAEGEVLALELVEPAVPLTWTDGEDFVCVCKGQPTPDEIAEWSEKPSFEFPSKVKEPELPPVDSEAAPEGAGTTAVLG